MIYAFFLFVFVQKSFLTKKLFLFAEINLTTQGPLYTCLVLSATLDSVDHICWAVCMIFCVIVLHHDSMVVVIIINALNNE